MKKLLTSLLIFASLIPPVGAQTPAANPAPNAVVVPGQIPATATNAVPAAGNVGSTVTNSTSGTALSNGSSVACTSVSLAAGNWLVWGTITFNNGGASVYSQVQASINTSAAEGQGAQSIQITFQAGDGIILSTAPVFVSLSTTTTYDLVGGASWTTASPTCNGSMTAIRMP
jgi:hypothetical protein